MRAVQPRGSENARTHLGDICLSMKNPTQWVRSYSRRRGENSFPYAVPMLSRRTTAGIAPSKLDLIVFKTENHIVTVGQRASGKAVTAEMAVFSSQTVQVYDVSDLHNPSVSQGGQSLSITSRTTVFSAKQ